MREQSVFEEVFDVAERFVDRLEIVGKIFAQLRESGAGALEIFRKGFVFQFL